MAADTLNGAPTHRKFKAKNNGGHNGGGGGRLAISSLFARFDTGDVVNPSRPKGGIIEKKKNAGRKK